MNIIDQELRADAARYRSLWQRLESRIRNEIGTHVPDSTKQHLLDELARFADRYYRYELHGVHPRDLQDWIERALDYSLQRDEFFNNQSFRL